MNFMQKTLLIYGIVLALSVFCEGKSLYDCYEEKGSIYDAIFNCRLKNKPVDKDSPVTIFDAIFHPEALETYGKQLSKEKAKDPTESCWLSYKRKNYELIDEHSENMRKCMKVSDKDIEKYFKKHDEKEFEDNFNKDLMDCISKAKSADKIMDCYVDTICEYLNDVKDDDKDVSNKKKRCVRSEMESYVSKTNDYANDLNKCLAKIN